MSFFVIDLETILDRTLPAPPELTDEERRAGKREVFPAPPLHQVVCCGWALLDSGLVVQDWGVLGEAGETEPEILGTLVEVVADVDPVIVTLNGRGFDLPVVAARCFVWGIPWPWYYRPGDRSAAGKNPRYRYTLDDTYDVMDHLSDHGAAPRASLDVWARCCGWPGKPEGVSGALVEAMVAAGDLAGACRYCLGDVAEAAAILLRSELLRGALPLEGYVAAAEALLEHAAADPRTAEMAAAVDVSRFLCEPWAGARAAE